MNHLQPDFNVQVNNHYVIIIAGGKGERFWPQSRLKKPKHLLPIVGDSSMIMQTISRVESIVPFENILIITHKDQKKAIHDSCPLLKDNQVIAEPLARDTAAAVGLASVIVKKKNPSATLAIVPADQAIHDVKVYKEILQSAFLTAQENPVIVTLGVCPTFPATGYGYLKKGPLYKTVKGHSVYGVRSFTEKPNLSTALSYLNSGLYFWNTGSFIVNLKTLGNAFSIHYPLLAEKLQLLSDSLDSLDSITDILEKHYIHLPKISIDYAIMEKSKNIVMIESLFDWDDVGSWPSLERHIKPDENQNVTQGLVVTQKSKRNIIISNNDHLVGAVGVDDLIIVHTADATLVCHKHQSDEIKNLIKEIEKNPKLGSFL